MTSQKKRYRFYISLVGLLITVALIWLQITPQSSLAGLRDRLDWLAYDLRLNLTLPTKPPATPIAILDIDERSLQAEGRWPWSREKLARLIDRLFESGALVVAFDMVLAEAERNAANEVLQRLPDTPQFRQIRQKLAETLPGFDHDAKLADSLRDRDVILGYVFRQSATPPSGQLPEPLNVIGTDLDKQPLLPEQPTYTANIEPLQSATPYGGFFTTSSDEDGIIRRTPLIMSHAGQLYGALALEAARLYLLLDEVELQTALVGDTETLEAISLGNIRIPVDASGSVLIPYQGQAHAFPYLSATDVLSGQIGSDQLENRIVFIGTSATGLVDLRSTPVSKDYPGVEVHANIVAGILGGGFRSEPAWSTGANVSLLAILGLILSLIMPRLNALSMGLSAIFSVMLVGGINLWVWSEHELVLALATPLLLVASISSLNLIVGFLIESRNRDQLKGMFGHYVPPQLVEKMSANPDQYHHDGESRVMTVLFADIRNFTSISESLSATELRDLLNRFLTPMTRIIFEHNGTIDKYVGDMVMAFWGAPVSDEHHARHAVEAAMAMLEEVERLKPEFKAQGLPEISIGIGINTGLMNVGDMGSEYRRAYTVLGDAVNLASRLEGLTKYYGVALVVGEETHGQVDGYLYQSLDLVRVKGRKQALVVYRPLCKSECAEPAQIKEQEDHEQAMSWYLQKQWQQAHEAFSDLAREHPNTAIYRLYLERIARLEKADPGPDWDGVTDRRTK